MDHLQVFYWSPGGFVFFAGIFLIVHLSVSILLAGNRRNKK